jgi:hypothetical protein
MTAKSFKIVGEEEAQELPPNPKINTDTEKAMQILMLSLVVVGKRFITALSHLFTAAALLSAWLLWRSVLPSPTVTQLIGVTLFGAFVLAIEWVRRK